MNKIGLGFSSIGIILFPSGKCLDWNFNLIGILIGKSLHDWNCNISIGIKKSKLPEKQIPIIPSFSIGLSLFQSFSRFVPIDSRLRCATCQFQFLTLCDRGRRIFFWTNNISTVTTRNEKEGERAQIETSLEETHREK